MEEFILSVLTEQIECMLSKKRAAPISPLRRCRFFRYRGAERPPNARKEETSLQLFHMILLKTEDKSLNESFLKINQCSNSRLKRAEDFTVSTLISSVLYI